MSCAEQNFCYFPLNATDPRGTENDIAQNKFTFAAVAVALLATVAVARTVHTHVTGVWHARHQRESYRHAP